MWLKNLDHQLARCGLALSHHSSILPSRLFPRKVFSCQSLAFYIYLDLIFFIKNLLSFYLDRRGSFSINSVLISYTLRAICPLVIYDLDKRHILKDPISLYDAFSLENTDV